MKASLLVVAKLLGAIVIWFGTVFLISDSELAPFVGTLVLVAMAACLFFFGNFRRLSVVSGAFLLLVVLVSHGTDVYFWSLVWNQGFPWPLSSPRGNGVFIGSITPFIYQVSIVSFAVLLIVAMALATWHLTGRSRQRPKAAPEL